VIVAPAASTARLRRLASIATAPLIYSLILPLALLDIWVTVYQHICFRAYGMPRVRRGDYLVLDRLRLPYLDAVDKINCTCCSYSNGVIAYVREVASRTEQYWCPIKHDRPLPDPHRRYGAFAPFGDEPAYRERREPLREELRGGEPAASETSAPATAGANTGASGSVA
jgi:hypothetical protein